MTTAAAPRIRKLSPLLVNQIAAGEVIERPASVVKELVENALDSGATRVAVALERGGLDLISVTDDGRGIAPDELPLALEPHATSKVAEPEDLDRIGTMGFRGEALASIASVARVTIRSREPGAETAFEISAEGGAVSAVRPAAGPVGTRIEVRTLFYNTPARRKFVRGEQTERTRCLEWVRDLAMAHPAVGFRVAAERKTALDLPPAESPRERAEALLGKELAGELLEVSVDRFDDDRGVLIWGLVGRPSIARPTARAQHVFLNGRLIRDKSIQHALREAYRGVLDPGRHPTAVLMLEMAPGAVDVNVHPAKLEVRFRDQGAVYAAVLTGVREALRRADLTPRAAAIGPGPRPEFGPADVAPAPAGPPGSAPAFDAAAFADRISAMRGEAERAAAALPDADEARRVLAQTDEPHPPGRDAGRTNPNAETEAGRAGAATPAPERPLALASAARRFLQVHNAYVVVEDDQGLVLVDQHALHERAMFETLLARVRGSAGGASGGLESQRLLTPAVVDASAGQLAALERLGPLLTRLGIEAAPIGPAAVAVHAFPSLLFERRVEPGPFLAELLERAEDQGLPPDEEAAIHEVLDMMACKAAVKAGDRLAEDELAELLRLRETVERSSNCPHGRPTSVRLTLAQLEKLFERR